MTTLLSAISLVGDAPEYARKGTNAVHIMTAAPVMMGNWDVKGICATALGSSGDDDMTMGTDLEGPVCKRCERIYAAAVAADRDAAPAPVIVDTAKRDAFVAALFAPELGIDGEPWEPGDNPARRKPENFPGADESTPLMPRLTLTPPPVVKVDRKALMEVERTRRAERRASREGSGPGSTSDSAEKRERAAKTERARLLRAKIREEKEAAARENSVQTELPVTEAPAEAPIVSTVDVVEFDDVNMVGERPKRVYPDVGESHIMLKPASVAGVWDVTGICRTVVGKSDDESIRVSTLHYGKTCERCDAIFRGILAREIDYSVRVCEHTGPVDVINAERTHGKCPACTTYIPLLPESESEEGTSAPVSKEVCGSVGDAPASGTRVLRDNHEISATDDYQGKTSAPCPGCKRIIAVSRDGVMRRHNGVVVRDESEAPADRIGTHNVGNFSTPATPGLKSRMLPVVDTGSTPGDTSGASKRRDGESTCPRSGRKSEAETGGLVKCPDCTRTIELKHRPGKGDDDAGTWVYATHLRACVCPDGKCVGADCVNDSYVRGVKGERKVTPRGKGADVGATAAKGSRLALSRGHGTIDGSANVGAQDMPPVRPGGWVGKAGTNSLPALVRPGVDKGVIGKICPLEECGGQTVEIAHADKSKSWRRRHSTKVGAVMRDRQARLHAEHAAKVERGEILSRPERKARRKAASVGSFAEGVNAHTGAVTHGPREGKTVRRLRAGQCETPSERETRRRAVRAAAKAAV